MAASRERSGRPTQFHGVSIEERAVDSQGNRLPWALEWADDHPNARHQKRQPEEKGSFGKSTKRKGSSRATRTQTPAKKENPALEGFEAALKFDAQTESFKQIASVVPGIADSTHQNTLSMDKEPTQVILYGYSTESQWAAINYYENVSKGMICEDYERGPPMERKRYQSGLGYQPNVSRRTLTKEERALAMRYQGGTSWIKVTFDSREAAERAIASSPHLINGHWAYAEPFRGQGPEIDQPILVREEDRQQGILGAPKPPQRPATLGASSGLAALRRDSAPKANSTLPRSFLAPSTLSEEPDSEDQNSVSSATASSATATAPEIAGLRKRETSKRGAELTSQTFTHFPETPKTVLRPATEALLPQLSWSERLIKHLTQGGWIPGDMIGNTVPRLENGDFDLASSSIYWRLCYWIDSSLGTDLCGMKDN